MTAGRLCCSVVLLLFPTGTSPLLQQVDSGVPVVVPFWSHLSLFIIPRPTVQLCWFTGMVKWDNYAKPWNTARPCMSLALSNSASVRWWASFKPYPHPITNSVFPSTLFYPFLSRDSLFELFVYWNDYLWGFLVLSSTRFIWLLLDTVFLHSDQASIATYTTIFFMSNPFSTNKHIFHF